jgi:hypothetical protein
MPVGKGTFTVQLAAACADPPPFSARTTSVCGVAASPTSVRGLAQAVGVAPSRPQVTEVELVVVKATIAVVSGVEPDGALVSTTVGTPTVVHDAEAVAVRPEKVLRTTTVCVPYFSWA